MCCCGTVRLGNWVAAVCALGAVVLLFIAMPLPIHGGPGGDFVVMLFGGSERDGKNELGIRAYDDPAWLPCEAARGRASAIRAMCWTTLIMLLLSAFVSVLYCVDCIPGRPAYGIVLICVSIFPLVTWALEADMYNRNLCPDTAGAESPRRRGQKLAAGFVLMLLLFLLVLGCGVAALLLAFMFPPPIKTRRGWTSNRPVSEWSEQRISNEPHRSDSPYSDWVSSQEPHRRPGYI